MRKNNTLFFSCFVTFLVTTALLLSACTTSAYRGQPWNRSAVPAQATPSAVTKVQPPVTSVPNTTPTAIQPDLNASKNLPAAKVAILLPLSGPQAALGQSMLKAAQMAVFDLGHENFELLPKDTQGPGGARSAAQAALTEGASLVLGPLFANEVKDAKSVTSSAGVNMIAFSTDWTLADSKTFLLGFMPFDQVERIVRYAAYSGYKRVGVLGPNDAYGNAVISTYQSVAKPAGITMSQVERISPRGENMDAIVRAMSDYDRRAMTRGSATPFDAVLMPVGGGLARTLSMSLSQYGLPHQNVRRLGTGLFDDPALARDPSLSGAWFAAPSPQMRKNFEQRYHQNFGETPPRLASLSYDATALAAILARMGLQGAGKPAFDSASITNPNGFTGVDGIFRFRPDGIVERGLAILEFRNGQIAVINDAPATFQANAF